MQDEFAFRPDRRMGLIFHITVILLFTLASLISLWLVSQASIGPMFMLYLLPVLAAVIIVPILAYRIYALQTASYILEREGIRVRWGLRSEDIPMDDVLWVHPAAELSVRLPLPALRWPGAVLGKRRLAGGGEVEFLAGNFRDMLYIAMPNGGIVISPADPDRFLEIFQRFTEMGSLSPLPARSVYPAFLLARVWSSKLARVLLLTCIALGLALIVWVSLSIQGRSEVHLGFQPDGSPGEPVPAVRLMLIPLLNSFFFLVALFLGMLFFRREDSRPLAYILWMVSLLTNLLFLLAVYFSLKSG
jgi:Bacterial PH domain